MLSFLLCFALIDYTIYSATGSSPLSWIWKFFAVVTYVVSSFPLSSYVSITTLFLFGSIAFIGIVLVMISKSSAMKAMEAVSEKVVTERPLDVYPTVDKKDSTENVKAHQADETGEPFSLRSLWPWQIPEMGVTADHRHDAGGGKRRDVRGHHARGPAQESVRRGDHAPDAYRDQPVDAALVRELDLLDGIDSMRGRFPQSERAAWHLLAQALPELETLGARHRSAAQRTIAVAVDAAEDDVTGGGAGDRHRPLS